MAYTSRRCSVDDVNWPMAPYYQTCPICGGKTWMAWNEPALSDEAPGALAEEHRSRLTRRAQFDLYYEQREEKRIKAEVEKFIAESLSESKVVS